MRSIDFFGLCSSKGRFVSCYVLGREEVINVFFKYYISFFIVIRRFERWGIKILTLFNI